MTPVFYTSGFFYSARILKAFHFLTHCLFLAVELGGLPSSALPRLGDGVVPGDPQDSSSTNTHFDFSPCTLEHLQEEEAETNKWVKWSPSRLILINTIQISTNWISKHHILILKPHLDIVLWDCVHFFLLFRLQNLNWFESKLHYYSKFGVSFNIFSRFFILKGTLKLTKSEYNYFNSILQYSCLLYF